MMKEKLIRGITAALNGIYSIFKLFPVKKKITYISRQSNVLPVDFDLVIREMERRHPEYQQVALIKMIGKSIPEKIGYCFHIFRQMYHIATSEMVVLDTYCIAVSVLQQRKSLVVIQMWHALGAMKKFGYSILDKGEGTKRSLAEAMRMHKNYTYIFSSSEFCCRFFAEAFHASMDQMVVMPLPRLDLLCDSEHIADVEEDILRHYPQLADKRKKTIVYAPTFRKEGGSFEEKELEAAAERLAEAIDYGRYNLVAKFHPLSGITLRNENVIQDKIFSTIDFCQMADAVILDYSAVVFEISMLGKPMYFYAFDYDSYMESRDVYIDFKKYVPGIIIGDPQKLMAAIDNNESDPRRQNEFRDLMISRPKSSSYTGDVADFFEKVLREQQERKRQ